MVDRKGTIPQELKRFMAMDNIAPELSEQKLTQISAAVLKGSEDDLATSKEWRDRMNKAIKVAKQMKDEKSYPWPGAANVAYPMVLTSCVQFNARLYPEIIQQNRVVNVAVMANDPDGSLKESADRKSMHMSYQMLGQSENWESDTDKLLMMLPMLGTVYRKSYFDPISKTPQVDLCLPSDIIVNNNISSLEKAERVTHVLGLSTNEIIERMRGGLYTEYSMDELGIVADEFFEELPQNESQQPIEIEKEDTTISSSNIQVCEEQHTYLDLDEDGYKEPYVVTVHRHSGRVLRIVARYDENSFIFDKNSGQYIKIKADQYFTDYHHLPSPDGTFLSLGYGMILYPINEVVDTIINQLLDAGTLSNLQSGFLSDSLRVRKRDVRMKPGEWEMVKVPAGSRLQDHLYPLPVNPPNPALFNLLQVIMEAGKEIGGVSDALLGQQMPANMPATTVMAMVEQGSKVYSSMLKRLYVSFKKEFEKLYKINQKYLDVEEEFFFAENTGTITLQDYEGSSYGVFPVADPSMSSAALQLAQAQALLQLAENPLINDYEVLKRYLTILKVPDIQDLLPPSEDPKQPKPPSPQDLEAQAKLENIQADTHLKNMQAAGILMNGELEIEEKTLKEKQLQADAAYKGGQLTTQKINAVSNLAQTEAQVGEKNLGIAERQANLLQQQIPVQQNNDTEQRLAALEQLMESLLGMQSQQQGVPQQGMPPGQETPQPGEPGAQGGMPFSPGAPPTEKTAEQMAPAMHVQEAEQAGETT